METCPLCLSEVPVGAVVCKSCHAIKQRGGSHGIGAAVATIIFSTPITFLLFVFALQATEFFGALPLLLIAVPLGAYVMYCVWLIVSGPRWYKRR